jgi:prepilin-type N-terminal cleavage/methylation domain-containing protein
MARTQDAHVPHGFTVLELLFAVAVGATMLAIAVPLTTDAIDDGRTAMAARYMEGRIMDARMHAVRRGTRIGLRFEPSGGDYRFAEYLDVNGNGLRTAEITAGIDTQLAPRQFLRDHFPRVAFGLQANVPDVDGVRFASATDGVRFGPSRILTLGPDGTASSGTLYVRGRRRQYAVRVLGTTGRTRVLRFEPRTGQWIPR